MKNKKVLLLPALLVSTLSANIILPSIIALSGMYSLFGWSLVLLDFILICACVFFLAKHYSVLYKLGAAVAMNVASLLLGTVSLVVFEFFTFGVVQLIFPARVVDTLIPFFTLDQGINILYGLFLLVAVVLINAGIQFSVGLAFFPDINRRKFFFWLLVVNILSISIGLFDLAWYVTKHGTFPGT